MEMNQRKGQLGAYNCDVGTGSVTSIHTNCVNTNRTNPTLRSTTTIYDAEEFCRLHCQHALKPDHNVTKIYYD
jgi:hypothetical protein